MYLLFFKGIGFSIAVVGEKFSKRNLEKRTVKKFSGFFQGKKCALVEHMCFRMPHS